MKGAIMENTDDTLLNLNDYETIFEYRGFCIGFSSDETPIDTLDKIIYINMEKYIKQAEYILIRLDIKNNQDLTTINSFLSKLHDTIKEDAELVYSLSCEDKLSIDFCKVNIMFSGLKELV
jgi:hypothetical protein